jgi:hypothetical protein
MTTHTSTRHSAPQVLQRATVSYVSIPPAAPRQELPITITKEEFHAVLDRDRWTRDRYEHRLGGQVVHSIDTLRCFRREKPPTQATVAVELTAAITLVKAEMVPLKRLLDDIEMNLDHPQRLHEALTSIEAMAAQLRAVVLDAVPGSTPQ